MSGRFTKPAAGAVLATLLTGAAALAGPATPAGVEPSAQSQVRAFLAQVYAHEATQPAWWDEHPAQVFDAALSHAIDQDEGLAASPDEETLTYDPLCQCQDETGTPWRIASLDLTNPNAAKATVALDWHGPSPAAQTITLSLVHGPAGWRVHDVASAKVPSLLGLLVRADSRRGGH